MNEVRMKRLEGEGYVCVCVCVLSVSEEEVIGRWFHWIFPVYVHTYTCIYVCLLFVCLFLFGSQLFETQHTVGNIVVLQQVATQVIQPPMCLPCLKTIHVWRELMTFLGGRWFTLSSVRARKEPKEDSTSCN